VESLVAATEEQAAFGKAAQLPPNWVKSLPTRLCSCAERDMDVAELDSIIEESLGKFCRKVLCSAWYGREHEMVSLDA
jgi:hypothetical protein